MKIKNFMFVFVVGVFLLASCQQTATDAPKVVPTPPSGKATVTGKMVPLTGSTTYANMVVYLAEVHSAAGQSAFALDTAHSPATKTDSAGNFVFTNIAPADYVVVLGDPMDAYGIIPDVSDANKAMVVTVAADKVLDLGTLKVDLK